MWINAKLSVRNKAWFNTNILVICWSFCVDCQTRRSVWNLAETGNTCWSSLLLFRNEMKQSIAFFSGITFKAYWLIAWTMEFQGRFMSSDFHISIYERTAINTPFQVFWYGEGKNSLRLLHIPSLLHLKCCNLYYYVVKVWPWDAGSNLSCVLNEVTMSFASPHSLFANTCCAQNPNMHRFAQMIFAGTNLASKKHFKCGTHASPQWDINLIDRAW